MDRSYKTGGKGKIIAWILVAVLLVAAVGAIFVVFNKKDKEKEQVAVASTFQEGMVINSMPTLRMGTNSGVRFTVRITPEVYNDVMNDEKKDFGMVLAPISYFMKVDLGEVSGDVDWMKEIEKESLAVLHLDEIYPYAVTEADGTLIEYKLNGVIASVKYSNTNLQFLGVGYIRTTDGEDVSYKYASFPEDVSYKQCAYSYAYLAGQRLNALVVSNEYVADSDLALLNSIINNSVDVANSLAEPTDDGSTYAVTLSELSKTLEINEEFTLEVDIAEGVKTPIWWQSSDPTVATVKNGVITAISEGETEISAFVAGEEYKCLITVGEVEENTEAVAE